MCEGSGVNLGFIYCQAAFRNFRPFNAYQGSCVPCLTAAGAEWPGLFSLACAQDRLTSLCVPASPWERSMTLCETHFRCSLHCTV